jgi:uroporphyrinogen-III synthase
MNLFSKRIVITRPWEQAQDFAKNIMDLGGKPILCPILDIRIAKPTEADFRILTDLSQFDWLIFTSANGIRGFCHFLRHFGIHTPSKLPPIMVVGSKTAEAAQRHALTIKRVAHKFATAHLLDALGNVESQNLLWIRGREANPDLSNALRQRNAHATELVVYDQIPLALDASALDLLRQGFDVATFASSATVQHFVRILPPDIRASLQHATIACIGPETRKTAEALGLNVHIVPPIATIEAMTQEIARFMGQIQKNGQHDVLNTL